MVSCAPVKPLVDSLFGVINGIVGSSTVTTQVALQAPEVAEIVAVPTATAVIKPVLETVATFSSLLP